MNVKRLTAKAGLVRASCLMASLALVAVLILGGCGGSSTTAANLRVLHASPDAPNVDINLDGKNVLTNVAYKTASDYLTVTAGNHTINVTLANGSYTTVSAVNFVAHIEGKVVTDDNTPPTAGNVKVRLIHYSPSAGNVDIYVTPPGADISMMTPTLSNVAFEAVSQYLSVPAGSYQVRITPTTTKQVVIDSGALQLAAGQIRTGVALDEPDANPPFTAIVLNDLN